MRSDVATSSSWLRLQSWVVGAEHHCRVSGPDLQTVQVGVPVEGTPLEGTIMIIAVNHLETGEAKDLEVDFLRVFQP